MEIWHFWSFLKILILNSFTLHTHCAGWGCFKWNFRPQQQKIPRVNQHDSRILKMYCMKSQQIGHGRAVLASAAVPAKIWPIAQNQNHTTPLLQKNQNLSPMHHFKTVNFSIFKITLVREDSRVSRLSQTGAILKVKIFTVLKQCIRYKFCLQKLGVTKGFLK